jgi:hypothetical protein
LAVRADDAEHVVRSLRLRTVLPANWSSALAQVTSEGVFVTPPVQGWVLVVGRDLAVTTQDPNELVTLLPGLSEEYGKALWFSTDEDRDVHGWAIAERGELLRGYAYIEEHGHTFWHGDITDEERELGCFLDDPRDQSDDEIKWWPDRRTVLALAKAWSLDPSTLGFDGPHADGNAAAVGWLGRM